MGCTIELINVLNGKGNGNGNGKGNTNSRGISNTFFYLLSVN